MLINDESGAFISRAIDWPGGPGLIESASGPNDQVLELQRLGPDGVSWSAVAEEVKLVGNAVGNFNLDKSRIRIDMTSGVNVFADVKTRRIST